MEDFTTSEETQSNTEDAREENLIVDIPKELKKEAKKMNVYGVFSLLLGVALTIIFFYFMLVLTNRIFEEIRGMHRDIIVLDYVNSKTDKTSVHTFDDISSIVFFLGIRTLVFGIVGGLIIFFIFKFSKACFDQATRFTKRKHATEFLDYISIKEHDLDKQMRAFYIWNLTIGSAFSSKETEPKNLDVIGKIFGAEANNEGVTANVHTPT
jgi:hypothetical protein